MDIENRLLSGDKRAVARLITLIENNDAEAYALLKKLYPRSGGAYVLGITGPPGAGKSTLTDKLIKNLRKQGKTVGVIAVDPTSPFTGGAILGDRIRMNDVSVDPGVFIRSMGTRGHLGGLSEATHSAIKVMDIFGFDYILIETVGVGQSEVEIVKNCDTTLMVMVPGLGDDIQALKAGVMEIGDVFAVNKADRDGADRTCAEIEATLDFLSAEEWRPPVKKVIAVHNEGIDTLMDAILSHRNHQAETGGFEKRRKSNARQEVLQLIQNRVLLQVLDHAHEEEGLEELSEAIVDRRVDPYTASERLIMNIKKGK